MLNVRFLAVLATIVVLGLSSVANAEGIGVRGLKKNDKKDGIDEIADASLSRTVGHAKTKKEVSSTPQSAPKDVEFGPKKSNLASSKRSQTTGQIINPVSDSDPVSLEELIAPEDIVNPAKATKSRATFAPRESTSAQGEGVLAKTRSGRYSGRAKRTKTAKGAKKNARARRDQTAVPGKRVATRAPSSTVSPSGAPSDAPSTAFSGTDSPSIIPTVFREEISRDVPIIFDTITDAPTPTRGNKSEKSDKLFI